jgi:hypothetical protein
MVSKCIEKSYENILSDIQNTISPEKAAIDERKIEIGVAIKAFNGEKEQDLTFKNGEKILIESKIKGSSWFFGSIGNRKGWFPASHVRVEEHFI